jgi:hypothetical protein
MNSLSFYPFGRAVLLKRIGHRDRNGLRWTNLFCRSFVGCSVPVSIDQKEFGFLLVEVAQLSS